MRTVQSKGLKRAVRIAVFCGVILAALSGCIRIEQNQPPTTQSYQPSGFRYHSQSDTASTMQESVSETDSTQPEDEPPDYPLFDDDIPDYPFFDDDPEFITSATTAVTTPSSVESTTASTVKKTDSTTGSAFSTATKTAVSTVIVNEF